MTPGRARPDLRRWATVVAVGLAVLVGAAGCGDDVPSKSEFTSEIARVTDGRVPPELGGCIYDKMVKSQGGLLRRAMSTPDLTDAENEQITNLLAQCIVERDESTTGTTEGDGSP
jgi:hypothetical protein